MQSPKFTLTIQVEEAGRTACLTLEDASGRHKGFNRVDFTKLPASEVRGLLDLREYLHHYIPLDERPQEIRKIGVAVAGSLLGQEIYAELAASREPRSLRVCLVGAEEHPGTLTAALTRVPWEFARATVNAESLQETNLAVRVIHDPDEPPVPPLKLGPDETVRALFVFAESFASPLLTRRERHRLRELFEKEIYPKRRVEAHFLSHGVTHARLTEFIERNGPYHIVHWSGHGSVTGLDLASDAGRRDTLTGMGLRKVFQDANQPVPRLFFLSACNSGVPAEPANEEEFNRLARTLGTYFDPFPERRRDAGSTDDALREVVNRGAGGFTGVAHGLLSEGVYSVVAMRHSIGDEYAADLAVGFYERLLANPRVRPVAEALKNACKELYGDLTRYNPADPATPVLYGAEDVGITLPESRSPAAGPPRLPLGNYAELHRSSPHFVGRARELSELETWCLRDGGKPVAVITGLGGMGKSALAAEVLDLYGESFDHVLAFRCGPEPLTVEGFLVSVHNALYGEMGTYHDWLEVGPPRHPADAIYRPPTESFRGPERYQKLTGNLIRALQNEKVLLILDNLETLLRPEPEAGGATTRQVWRCRDAAWDDLLSALANPDPTRGIASRGSRVLITSRHSLHALPPDRALPIRLGPLSWAEAQLYLRDQPQLRSLVYSNATADQELALRVIKASRFHPLLMDRLGRLADEKKNPRTKLLDAIEALEESHRTRPKLFDIISGDEEIAYLEDALKGSVERLITHATTDAQRLLWVLSLAHEPVPLGLLKNVWGRETERTQTMREVKANLENRQPLSADYRQWLENLPEDHHMALNAMLPPPPSVPEPEPLLNDLIATGLLDVRQDDFSDDQRIHCHEVVREGVHARTVAEPEVFSFRTESAILTSYANWYAVFFEEWRQQDKERALAYGALAVAYAARAGNYSDLAQFAGPAVTAVDDPRVLAPLIVTLTDILTTVPEGRIQWNCHRYLADALCGAGQPDKSLEHYDTALTLARKTAEDPAKTEADRKQAWEDVRVIHANRANANHALSRPDAAREDKKVSLELAYRLGSSELDKIHARLEILRQNLNQSSADRRRSILEEVNKQVSTLREWWRRTESGEIVPQAQERRLLSDVLTVGLDVATQCCQTLNDWEGALKLVEERINLMTAERRPMLDIFGARSDRATILYCLGPERREEARKEFEDLIAAFDGDAPRTVKARGSLAEILYQQKDYSAALRQARMALILCNNLPDPCDRANLHDNLANYLEAPTLTSFHETDPGVIKRWVNEETTEALDQRLAATIYWLGTQLRQRLETNFRNWVTPFHHATLSGETLPTIAVAKLLSKPEFVALAEWLKGEGIAEDAYAALQAAVDLHLDQVKAWVREHFAEEQGKAKPSQQAYRTFFIKDVRQSEGEAGQIQPGSEGLVTPGIVSTHIPKRRR
jgi:tetratricopeptide (TPR) repeat protein